MVVVLHIDRSKGKGASCGSHGEMYCTVVLLHIDRSKGKGASCGSHGEMYCTVVLLHIDRSKGKGVSCGSHGEMYCTVVLLHIDRSKGKGASYGSHGKMRRLLFHVPVTLRCVHCGKLPDFEFNEFLFHSLLFLSHNIQIEYSFVNNQCQKSLQGFVFVTNQT